MIQSLSKAAVPLVLILFALLSVAFAGYIVSRVHAPPEILLTLVLVTAVIALVSTIAGLLWLLRAWGLASRDEALGLPPGSIRAILALMLVLIFAIMSIFLFYQSTVGVSSSRGIGLEQLNLLPADRIVSIVRAAPGPNGEEKFDVAVSGSIASQQLAQQLVTLLGTLVTAIAAFYFGSSSVATALKGREGQPIRQTSDLLDEFESLPARLEEEASHARTQARQLALKKLAADARHILRTEGSTPAEGEGKKG